MAWLADARIDVCSSRVPSADRHLTEGIPCCLARIVIVSDRGTAETR